MGAQRVKTNFDELERNAAVEASRDVFNKPNDDSETNDDKEEIDKRLAYKYEQNLVQQAKKFDESTKNMNRNKVAQAERLGMGFGVRRYYLIQCNNNKCLNFY